MSHYALVTYHLTCDEPGCSAEFTVLTGDGVRSLRRAASAQEGWRYAPGHPTTGPGRDLCPVHAGAR